MPSERNTTDEEVRRIAKASLGAAGSIRAAAEAATREMEGAASATASGGIESDGGSRLGLALKEVAQESLESIREQCDNLAAASERAVSLSGGPPVIADAPTSGPAGTRRRAVEAEEASRPSVDAPAPLRGEGRGAPFSGGIGGQEPGGVRPLLRAISAHRWIVAAGVLAALLGAAAYLALGQSTYEATANVLVQPVPEDDPAYLSLGVIRDTGDPLRTTQTAAALLDTREAASQTAMQLGASWSPDRVEDSVAVSPIGETSIIAITGVADSPNEAVRLADAFAEAGLALRDKELAKQVDDAISRTKAQLKPIDGADPNAVELTNQLNQLQSIKQSGDPSLDLQQTATAPDSPTEPGAMTVIPLALLAGLVLGSGGALLRELFDRRIVDAEEAARIYPISVLTRVPVLSGRSLKAPAGSSWYVPPAIREAFLTLSVQLEQRDRPPKTLLLTSATRGDGKTTSAINLAVTMATAGRSVILLDFDLRKPQVARYLQLDGALTPAEVAAPGLELEPHLTDTDLPGLRVLPTNVDDEFGAAGDSVAAQLRRLIRQACGLADYVVVDTPPLGEVSDALTLLREIDDILVVMRPGNTNRSHLRTMADLLDRAGRQPEGCILIDAAERSTSGYYSSGYGIRSKPDLVLGGRSSRSSGEGWHFVEERGGTRA